MISIAIAVTLIIILLVLRFKSAFTVKPKPVPTQAGQNGSQAPTAANTTTTAVPIPIKMKNWSYVGIIAIGIVFGIVAYQFEKSGLKESSQDMQKQTYSSPAPTYVEAPAAAPAPAPIVVKAETPEKVSLSGRFQVCQNASCSKFDLWPGANIISQSAYADGRKLVLELNETAPNVFAGSLSEEKRPPENEDMRWTISELRFELKNGKVFGSGHFEGSSGSTGVITVKKIS